MRRFDSRALYEALNEQRERRSMTWAEVSREICVSASTLRNTKKGGRMEVDGVIAMVDWLDATVEKFVRHTSE